MRKKAAALKYDKNRDAAPVVTARGKGKVAEKIIAAAEKYGVAIKEDPDLVEVLATLDVYSEIPENLYKAVAEILAELYKINKNAKSGERG